MSALRGKLTLRSERPVEIDENAEGKDCRNEPRRRALWAVSLPGANIVYDARPATEHPNKSGCRPKQVVVPVLGSCQENKIAMSSKRNAMRCVRRGRALTNVMVSQVANRCQPNDAKYEKCVSAPSQDTHVGILMKTANVCNGWKADASSDAVQSVRVDSCDDIRSIAITVVLRLVEPNPHRLTPA